MTADNSPADDRSAFIAGLRDVADFLETHPDVPMPDLATVSYLPGIEAATDQERHALMAEFADRIGADLYVTDDYCRTERTFGPVILKGWVGFASGDAKTNAWFSYHNSIQP